RTLHAATRPPRSGTSNCSSPRARSSNPRPKSAASSTRWTRASSNAPVPCGLIRAVFEAEGGGAFALAILAAEHHVFAQEVTPHAAARDAHEAVRRVADR